MIPLSDLVYRLGYKYPHYLSTDNPLKPETAHLFRAAQDAGVAGIYVFETSPGSEQRLLAPRPVVYVAEAQGESKAREIHRSLWNLNYAPFLIVRLPNQIRIYTGFKYSHKTDEGLLGKAEHLQQLLDLLTDFKADAIDSGRIWKSEYAKELDPNERVDKHLLKNLQALGKALKESGLRDEVAHALIGKYVYLSYLRHRNILYDEWLSQQQIDPQRVFTLNATIHELKKLVEALDVRLNGEIFPIDFDKEPTLKDDHVSWVASVFRGAEIVNTAPKLVQQLHLSFQAYDFRYIPVETLSAIYEQFIYERKAKGAIYTPEILADYLLSEVESVKRLERGMKILDPACGSGVFLVLAYRRLIEKEMDRLGRKLKPEELRDILQESIYGVERERDACYVTEFSLILTLLHYADSFDLLQNLEFQFPRLHNNQIIKCDFFDIESQECESKFWQQGLSFDFIIGNPPWIELKPSTQGEQFVRTWMENPQNKSERPIGGNRVAEAFSWIVTDLLKSEGIVGLILPATSLFNLTSQKYRQYFFSKLEVLRITNFANLRDVLFGRRGTLPATSIVYHTAVDAHNKSDIIHYGPFSVNQVSHARKKPWVIVINENEIQRISSHDAIGGETAVWKFALWGTYRDKRAIERIDYLFPVTLKEICEKKGWSFHRDIELRDGTKKTNYKLEYVAELKGKKRFRADLMEQLPLSFSIPPNVLEYIPDEMCYIRKRGGKGGLKVIQNPHIILSPSGMRYVIYSDEDFVIAPKHMGISASREDALHLKALSVYLSSSLAAYYLFFHAQEWGIFRQAKWVSITEVGKIRIPNFTLEQIEELAEMQYELGQVEKSEVLAYAKNLSNQAQKRLDFDGTHSIENNDALNSLAILKGKDKKVAEQFFSDLRARLQERIDAKIFSLFKIPDDIRLLVTELVKIRLLLDKPSAMQQITQLPTEQELQAYGHELKNELDDFMMDTASHRVTITHSGELIECKVELSNGVPIESNEVKIQVADLTLTGLLAELSESLKQQISQWVYVQRGLRLFDGPRVYIYKVPYRVNWTRTQALNDAGDIIGQAITTAQKLHENT
ncbi:MAG: DNA methyltransferase [Anaerolineae bacterium]